MLAGARGDAAQALEKVEEDALRGKQGGRRSFDLGHGGAGGDLGTLRDERAADAGLVVGGEDRTHHPEPGDGHRSAGHDLGAGAAGAREQGRGRIAGHAGARRQAGARQVLVARQRREGAQPTLIQLVPAETADESVGLARVARHRATLRERPRRARALTGRTS